MSERDYESSWWLLVVALVLLALGQAGCLWTHRAAPGDQQCIDYREVGGC